jgi:hypothetical protein
VTRTAWGEAVKRFIPMLTAALVVLAALYQIPAQAWFPRGSVSFPSLVAGAGWSGLTAQPAQVGSPAAYGYGDNTIAIFDDVPYQTFTTDHVFYVLAYHNVTATEFAGGKFNSIAKVSCAVDGGSFVDVTTPTTNPADGRSGYAFTFAASSYSDGQHEVRCIAYPNNGWPLVLQGNSSPYGWITASASSGTMTGSGNVGDSVDCLTGCGNGTYITASLGGGQYTLSNAVTFSSQTVKLRTKTSLFLNSNHNGTLPTYSMFVNSVTGNDTTGNGTSGNPYATVYKAIDATAAAHSDVGGLTVNLQCPNAPSVTNYAYGNNPVNNGEPTSIQWMTVQAAAGCSQGSVAFNSVPTSGGLRTQNVHLKNLTITGIQLSTSTTINGSLLPIMWYDDVVQTGAGQTAGGNPTTNFTAEWYNDSDLSNMTAGPAPVLARNVTIHDIGSDAFSSSCSVINSTVRTIVNNPGQNYHPDVRQISTSFPLNCVVDGLIATVSINGQGLFGDGNQKDVAYAHFTLDNSAFAPYFVFQWELPTVNALLFSGSLTGSVAWRTDLGFTAQDVQLNSVACPSGGFGALSGVTYNGGTC